MISIDLPHVKDDQPPEINLDPKLDIKMYAIGQNKKYFLHQFLNTSRHHPKVCTNMNR